MASGNYAKRTAPQEPEVTINIPRRATRQLEAETGEDGRETGPLGLSSLPERMRETKAHVPVVINSFKESPFFQHRSWLQPLLLVMVCVIISLLVLVSAGMNQRQGQSVIVSTNGGQVYPIQLGGSLGVVNTWNNSTGPLPTKQPITHGGAYSVISKPTITVAFINKVLAAYHSPAAGKGQALYDLGVKYGIDPAFALAFFMHESSFGTAGVARTTLSLGNLRCIPNYACVGGYAGFSSWEQGFEEWYKLIRNLYVAVWGKTTVAQIIPTYAPSSDNNNVQGYIAAVEHTIDTWHSGQVIVS